MILITTPKFWLKLALLCVCTLAGMPQAYSNPPLLSSDMLSDKSGTSFLNSTKTSPKNLTSAREFLPPDEAFRLNADYDGGTHLRLYWNLEPGYYLYRQRFFVQENNGSSLTLTIPPGIRKHDEWFGDIEVYYDYVEVAASTVSLDAATTSQAALRTVTLGYQGCADAGLCYPLERRLLRFTPGEAGVSVMPFEAASDGAGNTLLGAMSTVSNGAISQPDTGQDADQPNTDESTSSEAGRLASVIQNSSLMLTLLVFFLAGIGLAFTPCVLPMAPILSAIIVGAHKPGTGRAILLSLTYVLGMAVTYAIAGALTGFFGARLNIQAALQNPWLLGTFSALFMLLALAMFGMYELRLPAALQDRVSRLVNYRTGSPFGAGLMGMASALIVSPCVSAPLAAALIYISVHQEVFIGAITLFALALGMGTPLLLLGFGASRFLPRAGAWMETVKVIAGICLLGLAVWLLERVVPPAFTLVLWGVLAIGSAFWFGTLTTRSRPGLASMRKAFSLVVLVYGITLVVGAAAGADNVWRPLAPLSGGKADHGGDKPRWVLATDRHMETLLTHKPVANRPTALYFYADWCITCRSLERNIFQNAKVQSYLNQMALFKVDITDNELKHKIWLERFNLFGPPALIFFDANGVEVPGYRLQGEFSAEEFANHLAGFLML